VVDAVDLPLGGRRVRVQPVDLADGCPSCGVISARVHAWIVQRVRDIPHAGQLEVMVRKPRLVCAEPECPRGTFTPATEQLPVRARCTTRLRTALLSAVIDSGRAVAEVAADRSCWVRRPIVVRRRVPQRLDLARHSPIRPPVTRYKARCVYQARRTNQRGGIRGPRSRTYDTGHPP
jgi:transposase